MENDPFVDDFPIKTSIYKGFSMAMLNNQMVCRCMSCVIQYLGDSHHLAILLTCKNRTRLGCWRPSRQFCLTRRRAFDLKLLKHGEKMVETPQIRGNHFFWIFMWNDVQNVEQWSNNYFIPMFRTYFREWSSMSERIKKGKASSCSSCLFLSLDFLLPKKVPIFLSSWSRVFGYFSRPGGFLTWFSKPKTLQAWSLVTAHLGNDLWSSLMELLLKNEKEMLQDRNLQKLLDFLGWSCHQQRCPKQKHMDFSTLLLLNIL